MEEAKNEYKIDFGPYSVELKGSQVYFRKNNSLVKAIPVKSTFGLYDLKKMVQQVAKKVNMLNKLPKDVLKAGKDRDLLKGDLDEDFVRSGHMYKSLTYKVTDSKAVMAAYKKFKAGNRTINMVVKASGDTITISGHPTKGLWISPGIADQLDVAIQKTGKATLVKSDSKKLREAAIKEVTLKGKDADTWIKNWGAGGRLNIDNMIYRSLGKGKWKGPTGKTMSWKEVAALAVEEGDNRVYLEGKLNEISAGQGLKDVMNGRTSSIEGIKMSKGLAQGIMAWIGGSSYGRKYAKQILKGRLASLLKPANAWGIQRFLDAKGNKEWKAIMSKVKESRSKNPIIPNYELQKESVISEADIKHFRKYLTDLGKHLGDRRLVQAAEKASSSKLKQMYDKDLHYKEFSDKEVTKYNIKKLHNMIKYDDRFDNRS